MPDGLDELVARDAVRKLFAGGQADIVLEEGVDVLESGIEITARPPGKELRALSLLSGGEKTLTAIALLPAVPVTVTASVSQVGSSAGGHTAPAGHGGAGAASQLEPAVELNILASNAESAMKDPAS